MAGLDTGCYCFRHIMLDAPKYNALKTETTDGEILELQDGTHPTVLYRYQASRQDLTGS